jgi:hypothetical protein
VKLPFFLIIPLFLFGGITAFARSSNDSVIVLPVKIPAPAAAKKLGTLKAGNNATQTHCDYEAVIAEAKSKARAMGGNIVKITKLIEPAFISKCYKIEADVLFINELPAYQVQKADDNLPAAGQQGYAMLYIYRLADSVALQGSYNVHLDDSVIATAKSRSRDSVKIYKEGAVVLWAETEKRKELKLNVKLGQTYYIRCGSVKGEIRMIPVMEVVDNNTGALEYGKLAKHKKDMKASYLNQIH